MGTSDFGAKSSDEQQTVLASLREDAQTSFEATGGGVDELEGQNSIPDETNARVQQPITVPTINTNVGLVDDFSGINQVVNNKATDDYSIKDNILNSFENTTYNFRLYLTSESVTHETLPQSDIVILAESGSTGYNITEVNMLTVISPSLATKNTLTTSINITIIEPFGTNLLDHIREMAKIIGVKDHKRVPAWIDLRFKGYTSGDINSYDGGIPTNELEKETRTWRIMINQIDIEMINGGTEYQLKCIAQDEYGLKDEARRIKDKINIDANTIGEFLERFAEKLNKYTDYRTFTKDDRAENLRRYVFSLPDTQSFSAKPIKDWQMRGSERVTVRSEIFNPKSEQFEGSSREVWRSTFDPGTSIEAIIQQIIGSTKEGQALAIFGEENKTIENDDNRNPLLPSIAFIVEPEVELLSYNGLTKDYNRKITYHIKEYKTFIPIISNKHIERVQNKGFSKEQLKAKLKISNIKKKYDYMYTGENTEILDYKITLNSAWFVSLPLYFGQNRFDGPGKGRDGGDEGPKKHKIIQTRQKPLNESIEDLKKKITSIDEGGGPFDTQRNQQLREGLSNQLKEAEAELELRVQQQQIPLGADKPLSTTSWGANQQQIVNDLPQINSTNIPNTTTSDNAALIGATTVKPILIDKVGAGSIGSIFYIENLELSKSLEEQGIVQDENSEIITVIAKPTTTGSTEESNIEGSRDPNRSFFSNIMNQIYGFKGELIKLDMEIKGDPYWLGQPNIKKRLLNTASDPHIDHTTADSLIMLQYLFPVAVDDEDDTGNKESYSGTGLYKLENRENGFNGVYRIISVEHNFSGGKFTQKLMGNIDPLTKEQDFLRELKEKTLNE